jgi:AAA domain/DnaB-like helicase N terminal domain
MNKADAAISDGHECVVLSALMNGEDALPVCADDFSSPPNRTIFERVSGLANRGLLAVTDALRFAGELDKVGGAGRITEIATLPHDEQNLKYALDQVLEHSGARQAAKIGEQLHKGEITPEQAQEKLATLIKTKANTTEREPRIRFFSPCLLRDFVPDNDIVLIGDCHIMRGEVFVIGGEPGVGKSLAATQLAVSGATQRDWFGLTVHRQFRTMIVQTENGRYRLRLEFSALDCDEIENWIRVSEPPPFGLTLTNKEFQADIGAALDSFKPECVIFDPWNAAARDDKQRDYVETFDALRNLLPTGSDKPALGIIAHTRKPLPNEKRTGGTGLMHLLAGSYILTSVPRGIFVMTRGSQDETDDSVVFFNPKNSNGENAPRSAWHRKLSGFTPATDFDWKEFDKPPEERKIIKLDHLREVFGDGKKRLELKEAAHDLATLVEVTESAAYNALKEDGKFSANISRSNGMLTFHSTKIPSKSR